MSSKRITSSAQAKAENMNIRSHRRNPSSRRGIALVPVMLIVSGLAVFTMALLTATMAGNRTVVHQADDHRLTSAVETASMLAMEKLWSGYLGFIEANGRPQTISEFRSYMTLVAGIPDESDKFDEDDDGIVELIPGPEDGIDYMPTTELPVKSGRPQINNVNIDAIQVVRVDVTANATQMFLTISASTTKGGQLVNPIRNRAVQQVYTIEPSDFEGFEFAMLANNINCIFCHTNVDSVDRFYNSDPNKSFSRVRVGSLESLVIRHDMNGATWAVDDFDADSFVAGTIYSRGAAILHDGSAVPDWDEMTLRGYEFDNEGNIVEGTLGLNDVPLDPAGSPPDPLENIYLSYASAEEEQVDGPMPDYFPAPIPDDGGTDPTTGLPDPGAIGNRLIDDSEFAKVAEEATGAITAGTVNVTPPGSSITTVSEYITAVFTGNQGSIQQSVTGNVVLTGSEANPIKIDGTVVIDGDVIIQGWVKGEGAIIARGNVYIPTDLLYFDDYGPEGRTFGENGGQANALGLMAGGNIMIGDYQRPATLKFNGTWSRPGQYEIMTGNPDTGDPTVDKWSFPMSEVALFNRGEWARTKEFLPGLGDNIDDPSTWSALNPNYDPSHTPRYYGYGEDTIIPIHNKSDGTAPDPLNPNSAYLYFDPVANSWIGDETAIGWDASKLSFADPNDPNDPFLTDGAGNAIAVTSSMSPKDDWIDPNLYQQALEYFSSPAGRGPLDGEPLNVDALLYTNNAIFSIVNRDTNMRGRMNVNGSLVAADLGMLTPGIPKFAATGTNVSPLSGYDIGLQLNYDPRVKKLINVANPGKVVLKRTLWNPTANLFLQ